MTKEFAKKENKKKKKITIYLYTEEKHRKCLKKPKAGHGGKKDSFKKKVL